MGSLEKLRWIEVGKIVLELKSLQQANFVVEPATQNQESEPFEDVAPAFDTSILPIITLEDIKNKELEQDKENIAFLDEDLLAEVLDSGSSSQKDVEQKNAIIEYKVDVPVEIGRRLINSIEEIKQKSNEQAAPLFETPLVEIEKTTEDILPASTREDIATDETDREVILKTDYNRELTKAFFARLHWSKSNQKSDRKEAGLLTDKNENLISISNTQSSNTRPYSTACSFFFTRLVPWNNRNIRLTSSITGTSSVLQTSLQSIPMFKDMSLSSMMAIATENAIETSRKKVLNRTPTSFESFDAAGAASFFQSISWSKTSRR
ncbi:MAG: hypothetical protein JNN15_06615 [Blastocatellia bacterium]|nr:hypothetical protein [Blastocatellia bacterium]